MKRKIVGQGEGGCTTTLPIKWIKENKLKPGDEIEIQQNRNNLIVSSNKTIIRQEFDLNINDENEPFIRVFLNNLDRSGYEQINIKTASKNQEKIVREIAKNILSDFKISNENNFLKLTFMGRNDETNETLTRKMFLVIKDSFNILSKDISNGSLNDYEKIKKNTYLINQYDNISRRNISKKNFIPEKSNFYWGLYSYLLLVQHSIDHLYNQSKDKIKDKEIEIITKDIITNYNKMYEGFFKKNLTEINFANNNLQDILYQKILKKIQTSEGNDSVNLYYLGEISRLVYLSSAPIIGILM